MDLTLLISYQLLLVCLGVSAIVFIIRKAVEFGLRKFNMCDNSWWRELILPILPPLIGTAVVLLTGLVPSGLETTGAKVLFGLVGGLLSGVIYRSIKSMIKSKLSKEDENE